MCAHRLVVGNAVPQYVELDVEHMPEPMLAWIIAYGFRPKAVHFRHLQAKDAPFAALVMQHQWSDMDAGANEARSRAHVRPLIRL